MSKWMVGKWMEGRENGRWSKKIKTLVRGIRERKKQEYAIGMS